MNCPGCYKKSAGGYCLPCRKSLFEGAKVSSRLPFDPPKADVEIYQEKIKHLSISGVQLKYSLRLNGKVLDFTEKDGEYILKPIPAANFLANIEQVPENEHLTMQIASQIFGIKTAANALIYFNDGTPAYITRRFDRKPDGSKYLQEDMAQLSGRTRLNNGEHFKYEGSYEDIGLLIKKYVAAAQPILETYFRVVLFNYIFSNGDAHLKNFSLLQTEMNDYALSPAYDLLSTVIHTPGEYDTALDLYDNDIHGEFYSTYGYYGQPEFRELARRIGMLEIRTERIISQILSKSDVVIKMIDHSFLDDKTKKQYKQAYLDKLQRLGKDPA
ncbi:hypothetical protein A4H97_22825 [Niastella yeongjuensis]|uniref:HipA-like C-terminal domain-containing protein n=1 Tax=Niastella yeongjuensis TaxID=354355 RepID=A0A1V9F7B3_9BACT|nr:HipA domain-containing protein [Niastella yeongjuensis]OQP54320.1 hypothetical protein A4H97_22825 [Niastella yeongjuensis]SEP30279.1 serine/threonine-protein kinase HipA [Niastella yeongjuensis]